MGMRPPRSPRQARGFRFSGTRQHGSDARDDLAEDFAVHLVDLPGEPLRADEAQLRNYSGEFDALVTDGDMILRAAWARGRCPC